MFRNSNKQEAQWLVRTCGEVYSPSLKKGIKCLCQDWTGYISQSLSPSDPFPMHWLVLCVNLTKSRVIREEGSSVEKITPWDSRCNTFSHLVSVLVGGPIYSGWNQTWAAGLRFYKKLGWPNHGKQVSK